MNIEQYKQRREEFEQTQSQERKRLVCPRCRRPLKNCLCSELKPFDPKIKVVILMHPMEAKKERIGTGRLSHLSLLNSEIIVGIDFTHHKRVNELIEDSNYLATVLYPGDKSLNITNNEFSYSDTKERELVVFIIDGTWPCAKKMMTLSTNLQRIPRICFTPRKSSQFSIKQQPDELCVSTIEAIYIFLDDIQEQSQQSLFERKHETLLNMLKILVDFQVKCATDPTLQNYRSSSFKTKSEKKISKKWESRKIFFRDLDDE